MEDFRLRDIDEDDDDHDHETCTQKPIADNLEKGMNAAMMGFACLIFILGLINMRTLMQKKRFRKSAYLFFFYVSAQLTLLCKFLSI
jgi:hypothetical protein